VDIDSESLSRLFEKAAINPEFRRNLFSNPDETIMQFSLSLELRDLVIKSITEVRKG
jgi:hypothetical protein